MQDICCKLSRLAAVIVVFLAVCVGSAWAGGVPWQVGDLIVCYGTGSCNVIRITGATATVLDQLSDQGFLGGGTPGFTFGAAIDDSLHVLVTDGGPGNQSDIVKYTIPSLYWLAAPPPPTPLVHTIVATFDGSVGTNSGGIRSVALDSAGHLYVGNSSPATLAEIDQDRPSGNGTANFPSGWRAFTFYPLNFIIIDNNTPPQLQKVTTAGTSGSTQPNFMQSGTTNDGTVVWTTQGSTSTPLGSFAVGGIKPPNGWAASKCYGAIDCGAVMSLGTSVFDTNGHIQQVMTPGTSGSSAPIWNDGNINGTTRDGAVVWTDEGNWQPNTPYSGTQVVGDTSMHLHEVKTPGTSGSGLHTPAGGWKDNGTDTSDNDVVWTNLGQPPGWLADNTYSIGGIISEGTAPGVVQQVTGTITETNSCTSDSSSAGEITPPNGWNQNLGGLTMDGSCIWTDLGPPSAWQPNNPYGFFQNMAMPPQQIGQIVGEQCGDNPCIQQVSTPNFASGKSGPANPSPAQGTPAVQPYSGWNPNGPTTIDGLTWTDLNSYTWVANQLYSKASVSTDPNGVVVDPSGHVQEVGASTDAGTSGPSQPGTGGIPAWTDGATPFGGKTTDGLQWTDTGLPGFGTTPCIGNQLASSDLGSGASPFVYFTSGGGTFNTVLQDAVVQQVTTPLGMSSTCKVIADFGPNVTLSGLKVVPAGATALNPSYDAVLVLATGTLDPDAHLASDESEPTEDTTDICTGNSFTGTPTDSCAILIDTHTGNTLATYTAPASNLQAVAIDPLITSCTGSGGTACSGSFTAAPTVASGNFWAGDGASHTFYQFSFGSAVGTFNPPTAHFSPAPPGTCNGSCDVEGMVVYAGEGANQVGLASLNSATLVPQPLNQTTANSVTATFLSNVITSSLYTSKTSDTSQKANLYVSPVDNSTCFNDGIYNAVNNNYGNNGLPCRQTTVTNNPGTAANAGPALAWKVDIPTGKTTALPTSETLATAFQTLPLPTNNSSGGNGTTDNATDVFVDMAFDVTQSVGNIDPTGKYTSVHSLHEVPFSTSGGGGCTNTSPLPKQCFQSRNTIPFKFSCPKFTGQISSLSPMLAIKQLIPGQAGNPINLFGTNGTDNYSFNGTQWIFNWNTDSFLGNFNACTIDNSGQVQSFCVQFTVAPKCK